MKKICVRCGKTTNENVSVCPYCGMHFASITDLRNQMGNQNNVTMGSANVVHNNLQNKKKIVVVIAVLVVLGICGTIYLATTRAGVSKKWIKNNVPAELLDYTISGEYASRTGTRTSEVGRVAITDQVSNQNMCYVDCEITLEDEDIIRTVYCEMELQRMNRGEWYLNSWKEIKKGTVQVKEEYAQAWLQGINNQFGYTLSEGQCSYGESGNGGTTVTAVYPINEEDTLLKATGKLVLEASLDPDDYYWNEDYWDEDEWEDEDWDEDRYPMCYEWSHNYDLSGVDATWDLSGNWSATIDGENITLNLTQSQGVNAYQYDVWNNTYDDNTARGEFDFETSLSDICGKNENGHEIKLFESENYKLTVYCIYIYPDKMTIKYNRSLDNWTDWSDVVEMKKGTASVTDEN